MRGSNNLRGNFTFGPRLAAAAFSLFALLITPAARAADTSRLHRAHQSTSSTPQKSSKPKSSKSQKPPAKPAQHSVAQNKPAPRSRHHAPEYVPPVMHRAHSNPRSRPQQSKERRAALTNPHSSSSRGQISSQPGVAVKKTLTTEDFMRAAGESDAPQPQRATTSYVAPYTPAPPPAAQRVDGFGAEGAMLTAPRNSAPAPATPAPAETDDPELAALSHPTHEELAESALQPRILNLYSRNGRLIVPAPLVGSHDVLVHQNEMADAEGLDRIEDDNQLAHLRAKHLLVDFPENESLQLNPDLPDNRRCARPWAVKFAVDMARAYYARFHQPLQINSAARTVQYQMHLEHINGNAAGVDGESASPHLTGQAIDFGKRGMSLAEIAWMRAYLKPLMTAGKLDVEEEFHQACFHVSVYRSYLPTKKLPPRTEVAQLGGAAEKESFSRYVR